MIEGLCFTAQGGNVTCKCGGSLEVSLVGAVAILKCQSCGRGELIPQSKPQEVFDYRECVARAAIDGSAGNRGAI